MTTPMMALPALTAFERTPPVAATVLHEVGNFLAGDGLKVSLAGGYLQIELETPDRSLVTALPINEVLMAIGVHTRKTAQA